MLTLVPLRKFWDNTGVTGTWAVCCEDMPFNYVVNFRFYRTIRHVEGDIVLHIPYIAALHQKDTSVQSLAKDSHLKDQLEEVVMSWERHVTAVIDSYRTKVQRIEWPGLPKKSRREFSRGFLHSEFFGSGRGERLCRHTIDCRFVSGS